MSAEPKTEAGCIASDYVGKFDGERGEPGEIPGGLDRVTYRVEQVDGVERRTRATIAESDAREESKGHLIRTWKRTSTAIPAHVCEVSAA